MSPAELLGWAGTVTGILLGLPQLVRLARTRNTEGLSLRAWQAMLAVNVGWTSHGILIHQPPQIITSALSLVATVPILFLLARDRRASFVLIALPGLALAAVMIGVDLSLGSGAFGAIAIIPAVISNIGQSIALVRSPHVGGVSPVFLALAVLNQAIWLTWATLVGDLGTVIGASTGLVITLFNALWYTARRLGVGAVAAVEVSRT